MRRELLAWLQREAPSIGPAYQAAVLILNTPDMPARVELLAHLIREIYSRLPEILDGEYRWRDASNVYKKHCNAIAKHWETARRTDFDGSASVGATNESTITISMAQANVVWALIDEHKGLTEGRPPSATVLLTALYRRHSRAGSSPPPWLVTQVKKERQWFNDRAHFPPAVREMPTEAELEEHFDRFEQMMYAITGSFFEVKRDLDAILHEANR